ncbi:uncharacterized protein F5147DRAFT_763976 [Suillus discolor]|uniref:Uncharacterized protein n=1 Tax=Suillus discolor TaxID=1912936 RepID=A0A9P7EXB6_9AGAM|nr:uncharacterized protein F5147DRAFT_763976 [Suillus discolor]KAG2093499.1 hypothetical protein F5147DRAFT_763976 [Suillus discolor]
MTRTACLVFVITCRECRDSGRQNPTIYTAAGNDEDKPNRRCNIERWNGGKLIMAAKRDVMPMGPCVPLTGGDVVSHARGVPASSNSVRASPPLYPITTIFQERPPAAAASAKSRAARRVLALYLSDIIVVPDLTIYGDRRHPEEQARAMWRLTFSMYRNPGDTLVHRIDVEEDSKALRIFLIPPPTFVRQIVPALVRSSSSSHAHCCKYDIFIRDTWTVVLGFLKPSQPYMVTRNFIRAHRLPGLISFDIQRGLSAAASGSAIWHGSQHSTISRS